MEPAAKLRSMRAELMPTKPPTVLLPVIVQFAELSLIVVALPTDPTMQPPTLEITTTLPLRMWALVIALPWKLPTSAPTELSPCTVTSAKLIFRIMAPAMAVLNKPTLEVLSILRLEITNSLPSKIAAKLEIGRHLCNRCITTMLVVL